MNLNNRITLNKGIVVLAVFALFASASVGAGLEEFASPTYAEDNAYQGAVDDATGDDDWKAIDSDRGMKKGAKSFIGKLMNGKMNDRMDDRDSHIQERMDIGQEIIIAYEYCLDNLDCTVDSYHLQEMIDNMDVRHTEMEEKLSLENREELSEEINPRFTEAADDDRGEEDEWYDCMTEEIWSDEKQEWCDENSEKVNEDEWFNCRTKELWSDEKKEWCDSYMDKSDWGDWDIDRKMQFSDDKAILIDVGRLAISFCLNNDDCTADKTILANVLEHMSISHDNHRDCSAEKRCDRGVDDRRGLLERFRDTITNEPRDEPLPAFDDDMSMGEESCEERGGEWTEVLERGDDFYYCNFWYEDIDFSDDDRVMNEENCLERGGTWDSDRQECYETCDRQDGEETNSEESSESENSDERPNGEESSESETSNQEDCEANGGTWSEERQECFTE